MEYIGLSDIGLKETRKRFLGVDNPENLEKHIYNITSSDVLFTDLDSCIADCLAERLPIYDLFSIRLFDKDYWGWGFRTASRLTNSLKGDDLEDIKEASWKDYHENVLGKDRQISRIEKLAESKVKNLLYPGTEEFFSSIPEVYKHLVTRNIPEMTRPFVNYLEFNGFETEAYNKDVGMSKLRNPYTPFLKYTFLGDHITFQNSQSWFNKYRHKSTKIFVSPGKKIPEDIAHDVNLHIGRDFTPLVYMIQKIEER